MSRTGRAQNELEQVLLEIGRIEQRLCWLRERATKLSHYIEIARDYAVRPRAWVGEENGSARGRSPRSKADGLPKDNAPDPAQVIALQTGEKR